MEDNVVNRFKFLHYFTPYSRYCGVILVCILFQVVITSGFTFSFKYLIDNALLGQSLHMLILIITFLAIAGVLDVFVGIYEDYLFSWLVANILQNIRDNIFVQLNKLSMRFYSQSKTGNLITHLTGDLLSIERVIVNTNGLVRQGLLVIINFILLLMLSWKLFLIALALSFFVPLAPFLLSKRITNNNLERKKMEADLLTFTDENILMQIVIRAFGLFEYISNLYKAKNNGLTKQIRHTSFLLFLMFRSSDLITLLLKVTLIVIGSYMVSNGKLSVGTLITFFLIYTNLLSYLVALAEYSSISVLEFAGIKRIQLLLNEEVIVTSPDNPVSAKFEKEISFSEVYFRYKDKDLILQDMNFSIAKGSTVAFVGSSGSGKSTIVNLIMRFYDPTSGKIMLDGINLRDISSEFLHQLVGYVPQEQLLFKASVRENILMGKLNASQDEVERAAKLAEIHETIIHLPRGYETLLEEQGDNLSQGQKQRIAIARAIIRQPEILILDESASALDPTNEMAINQTLRQLGKNCTTIAISHRLEAIKYSDDIYVMQKGMLCEQGTHDYLLSLKGVYANMWQHQTGFVFSEGTNVVSVTPERLKLIPIFDDLSSELLTDIASQFRTVNYPAGKLIVTEGEAGDLFYIIVRGRVEVVKNNVKSKPERIAVLEDGDYFGEIALIKFIPRVASVRTLSPTLCIVMSRKAFTKLISKSSGLKSKIEEKIELRLGLNRDIN